MVDRKKELQVEKHHETLCSKWLISTVLVDEPGMLSIQGQRLKQPSFFALLTRLPHGRGYAPGTSRYRRLPPVVHGLAPNIRHSVATATSDSIPTG
jgi:hypothetical protein